MRKFLITLLLAGAAASPALAQDRGRLHGDDDNSNQSQQHSRGDRGDRGDRGNRGDRGQSQQQVQQSPQAQQAQQQARDAARSIANGGHASRDDVRAAVRDYQMRHQGDYAQPGQQQQSYSQQVYQRNRTYRDGAANPAQRIVEQQIRQDRRSRDGNDWNRNNGGYYGQGTQHYSGDHNRRWANGGWDRNWRNDHRYDWRRYRNSHRSIFRLGFYYDPFGYSYRSLNIGYFMQPAYFGQRYWFDPSMYGLPYPPPGTQWVRYWNDAVLVDIYTGEVVDVIQGFFW
jgi:hypothetical protein